MHCGAGKTFSVIISAKTFLQTEVCVYRLKEAGEKTSDVMLLSIKFRNRGMRSHFRASGVNGDDGEQVNRGKPFLSKDKRGKTA